MYKAIFIDIDGTLRNNKKEVTKRTKEAVRKITNAGILVVLCSGRPRKYTEDISRECNASKYIITSGGGSIYDYEEDKTLYENIMDKQAILELYNLAEKENIRFIMNVGEGRAVNKIKYLDGSEMELKGPIDEFVVKNKITQCILSDSNYEKIRKLKAKIEPIEKVEIKNQHKSLIDKNYPVEGSLYYDIANIESSKGNAIQKFCEIMQISLKDTIGIGDDQNDIAMFQKVGYSVAMKNTKENIKQYADEITESNEEDGVAIFLEKLLKK